MRKPSAGGGQVVDRAGLADSQSSRWRVKSRYRATPRYRYYLSIIGRFEGLVVSEPWIGLSDAIAALRAELVTAMTAGQSEKLRFELGPVELEFTVDVHKDGSADAGIRWVVISFGARGSAGSAAGHRVKLVLQPKEILVVNSRQAARVLAALIWAMIWSAVVLLPSSRPRNRVCHVRAACPVAGAGSADRSGDRGEVPG